MNLYHQIIDLIPRLHGWTQPPKAITLANIVLAKMPVRVVEIGTYGGTSAFPMALALNSLKTMYRGQLICIDPWDSKASAEGQVTDVDKKWWGEVVNHEIVYNQFMHYRKELGLEDVIQVIRKRSNDVTPPENIQVLHCDGNHGPEAYDDITRFGSKVVMDGIVILDDLNWSGNHVARGAEWLKENGFIELHPLQTGAVYMKVK